MNGAALSAALGYAARGWPVIPFAARRGRKFPLTPHGKDDATRDPAVIEEWFGRRWPDALVAIATGEPSGVIALDIDLRPGGSGYDSLEALGVPFHPVGPTTISPSGGGAILFRSPAHRVPCSASKIGPFLDVRGDGGAIILPPGPGRAWDPHLGPDTPLQPMPEWMHVAEPEAAPVAAPQPRMDGLSRYGAAAIENAVKRIVAAVAGEQEMVLNAEAFSIGRLAGGNVIPPGLALDSLLWAARRMPSHDPRRPWRPAELDRKVRTAFTDGLREPRGAPHG